ncbi:MAG: hypothetical protein Q8K32_25735 [Archangium sp.]|nr:hypothetical protein [Archangium sp.]
MTSITVLVADDNAAKRSNIVRVIEEVAEGVSLTIDTASTVVEAATRMRDRTYDLLVLDLNIPMRAKDSPRPDGGVLLMQQIDSGLRRPSQILGLTSFTELASKHSAAFKEELWHLITYSVESHDWSSALARKIVQIVESKSSHASGFDFDLAIITALHSVELDAVLSLSAGWQSHEIPGDSTLYHSGKFVAGHKSIRVVAAAAGEMGLSATAVVSMKMIDHFRPRTLAMAGIAAGVKGAFGDILVADCAWDYGAGKRLRSAQTIEVAKESGGSPSVFLPAPSQIPIDPALGAKLKYFLMQNTTFPHLNDGWVGINEPPVARMGPIASGAAVVEDEEAMKSIVSQNRKLVGVEMESYAVFVACRLAKAPQPRAMSAKSICDFGVEGKGDEYQRYAAHTSARFIEEFALACL